MEILTLPRLRNHQLQSVTEGSLSFCTGIDVLNTPCNKVETCLANFIDGMMKDKASAKGKAELDTERDTIIRNLMRAITTDIQYPYTTDTELAVAEQLKSILKKYGTGIVRLSYNEQSAAVDNMLADIKAIDFAATPESGVARWIPLVETSNNNFKVAAKTYITDSAELVNQVSATEMAPALLDALEGLYTMMYAFLKVNPTPELEKAYTEISLLIESYR